MNKAGEKVKSFLKSIVGMLLAMVLVVAIIGALFLYSGLWPPLVVVESGSMEHSDDESFLGIIDTGDLVLVQERCSLNHTTTYVEGYQEGYRTYGSYGDVIIYKRYGNDEMTPVIHRAVLELVYNSSSSSFDIPSLQGMPTDLWSHDGVHDGDCWSLTGTVELYHYGYKDQTLIIHLTPLLQYHHGGMITKGDHNDLIDQDPSAAVCREPVLGDWMVGVARGELPWFGLLKLWAGGQFAPWGPGVAANSWTCLFVAIGVIIIVPLLLDVTNIILKKRGIDLWARFKAKLPRLRRDEKG